MMKFLLTIFGDEDILDNIVKQLQDQGIDASWDDVMDVS